GANQVIWNSTARGLNVQRPPTAQNWSIGNCGTQTGNGFRESAGTPVEPRSLYYAQLAEHLAGAEQREYWLGDMDNFTVGDAEDQPYVDPVWYDTVAAAMGKGHTIAGFDDATNKTWIPFTFQYGLGDGEVVVGASLSLGLRATGSRTDTDRIYLNSLDNG